MTNATAGAAATRNGVASPIEIAEAITAIAAATPPTPPPCATPLVDKQPMGCKQRRTIGTTLVVMTVLLMTQLLALWPAVMAATVIAPEKPGAVATPLLFGLAPVRFDVQVSLIAMVLMVGALGALVGGSRRFLYFATRDELTKPDETSYVLGPIQGAAL